jgi:hypothetical protein
MDGLDFSPTPDAQPGELIYLEENDLWSRFAFAFDEVESILEELLDAAGAELDCDGCFMNFCGAFVGAAFTGAGLVSLDMDSAIVAAVRNDFLAHVAAIGTHTD